MDGASVCVCGVVELFWEVEEMSLFRFDLCV
jgi:hypothetical protein